MTKILANLSTRQRITIALVTIAVAAGLYSLVEWRKESDFHPLFTGLSPEDAAGIVQKLKESGVDYRLPDSGGTVLVPSNKLADLRLTMAGIGLPKSGRIGFELFDKVNLGATEFTEHINYRRALEGELERTVMASPKWKPRAFTLPSPKTRFFWKLNSRPRPAFWSGSGLAPASRPKTSWPSPTSSAARSRGSVPMPSRSWT